MTESLKKVLEMMLIDLKRSKWWYANPAKWFGWEKSLFKTDLSDLAYAFYNEKFIDKADFNEAVEILGGVSEPDIKEGKVRPRIKLLKRLIKIKINE